MYSTFYIHIYIYKCLQLTMEMSSAAESGTLKKGVVNPDMSNHRVVRSKQVSANRFDVFEHYQWKTNE